MQGDQVTQFVKKYGAALIIDAGVVCLLIALFFPVPGDHLTTYKSLANDSGNSYIEEYVGGDAYNYIIGASLVGGHIAGAMATKSIFAVGGLILIAMGIVLIARSNTAKADGDQRETPEAQSETRIREESEPRASDDNNPENNLRSGVIAQEELDAKKAELLK